MIGQLSSIERDAVEELLKYEQHPHATEAQQYALAYTKAAIEVENGLSAPALPEYSFGIRTQNTWSETFSSLSGDSRIPQNAASLLPLITSGASNAGQEAYVKSLIEAGAGFALWLSGERNNRYIIGLLTAGYTGTNADTRGVSDAPNLVPETVNNLNDELNLRMNLEVVNDRRVALSSQNVGLEANLIIRVGNKSHMLYLPPLNTITWTA